MGKLRQALARYWEWLSGRRDSKRGVLSRLGLKKEQRGEGGRSAAARARFWTELREGQREAEAQCSRPRS